MRKLLPVFGVVLAIIVASGAYLYADKGPKPPSVVQEPAVEENVVALALQLGCPSNEDPLQCLSTIAADLYETEGASKMRTVIEKWQQEVLPNGLPCHRITHVAGKRAAETASVEQLRSDVTATAELCSSGFFHGAVEGMVVQDSGPALANLLQSFCATMPDVQNDCIHSAGHTLAMDSPQDVHTALENCSVFSPESLRCAAGVFMSYGRGVPGFEESTETRTISYGKDEASKVCYTVDPAYQDSCWFQLWIAYQSDPSLGGVPEYTKICPQPTQSSPVEQTVAYRLCYRGLGMLYIERGSVPPAEAAEKCPGDPRARYWCSFGIGWGMMTEHYTTFETTDGYRSDCGSFAKDYRPACKAGEDYALVDGNGL